MSLTENTGINWSIELLMAVMMKDQINSVLLDDNARIKSHVQRNMFMLSQLA